MGWLDLLAVQGTLKSLIQHHSSKASIIGSAFFIVQLSHDAEAETPVLWPPHAKSLHDDFAESSAKTLMWEGLGAGGEGDDRG